MMIKNTCDKMTLQRAGTDQVIFVDEGPEEVAPGVFKYKAHVTTREIAERLHALRVARDAVVNAERLHVLRVARDATVKLVKYEDLLHNGFELQNYKGFVEPLDNAYDALLFGKVLLLDRQPTTVFPVEPKVPEVVYFTTTGGPKYPVGSVVEIGRIILNQTRSFSKN